MVLRYLHKGWKTFWSVVLGLMLITLVLGGGVLALLQLDATKDIIAEKIENDFRKNYRGKLTIGSVDGLLPFNARLKDVTLVASSSDSIKGDTLASIATINVGIDLWGLLQKKLSIDAFSLKQPSVRLYADGTGSYTLAHALKKKQAKTKIDKGTSSWIKDVEIIAPQVQIENGSFYLDKIYGMSKDVHLPQPLRIADINAQMFVELTAAQRFIEMNTFTAQIEDVNAGDIEMSGQIYNDDRVLEFNAFHFRAGNSHIHFNGTIDGVDVYEGGIRQQLADARYDMDVSSHRLELDEFTDVITGLPDIKEPLDFSLQTNGSINDLKLAMFSLGIGESHFSIKGQIDNLFKKNQLAYQFDVDTLVLRKQDAEIFLGSLDERQYTALENLSLSGQASGGKDSLRLNIKGQSPLGSFTLNGKGQLVKPFKYQGSLAGKGVNIGPMIAGSIDTTNLNFNATIEGQNTSLKTGTMQFSGSAQNSLINNIKIDSLRLTTSLRQGVMEAEYFYRHEEQTVGGKGTANFNVDDPPITLKGNTKHVNLTSFFPDSSLDSTSLNTSYEIDLQGLKPDRMQGMATLEVEKSVVGGDSVLAHQIAVTLDSPDLPSRTLEVTGSLFNLTLTGDLKPSNISNQYRYWSTYFKERIAQEVRLDSTRNVPASNPSLVDPLQVQGNMEAKDLALVRHYWPAFPSILTNSTAQFKVTADASDLQFSSQIQSDTLVVNTVQVKGAGSQLSGEFKHDRTLKEYSNLHFQTDVGRLESNLLEMDSLGVTMNYQQDSLYYAQKVGRFSKDARLNLKLHSALSDSNITVAIDNFFLGDSTYAWQNEGTPAFTYNRAKEIFFDDFKFQNQKEFFALKGTLGPDRSDSLQYLIRDVNLGRISDLITGRVNFKGRLNGTLQTRSLTRKPSVQGNLTVNHLQLDDRLVGDVSFSSTFNEEKNRFDTKLKVITDSTKYSDYINANDDIGQNIVLDGYFKASDLNTEQDTVFYFDTNFNEIDMWAVQLLTHKIFTQLEGRASGDGYISGNLKEINYNADFQVNHVYARPEFINTNYYLDGHIGLNSKDGVIIDNVDITDDQGGTGKLWGSVDLNDFQPITFLDINMKLNDLRFLDNSYDPDVPFFGSLSGTGTIHLSGANTDMKLQSSGPITVSENSTLSIPLLEETQLNTTNSFIQFVDSFEDPEKNEIDLSEQQVRNTTLDRNVLENAIDKLSFTERFNLDLQFNIPNQTNVRLIFDPVTGEILKAEGTGRIRLAMNDGNLQMFGNYDVSGGSYQFVSGEIFARKLDIRPGGTITWEGPPDDARLNIEAVYHARPSLESLTSTGTASSSNQGTPQRVPIDLVVQITGTVSSVENDYYFELPRYQEISSQSTTQFTLNQINRDDQQKLLQATSILLTGNFLPTQSQNQSGDLGTNLSTRTTVINPLLSNQVISPLLSNQINSLLNSDAASFDIDFNLNAYNRIDLGIALRLYNDKLILRREGYLTGGASQNTFGERIGDLNATYRINNNLSLTAFHRQDQTLSALSTPTAANVDFAPSNGVGVEARVRFNTWQEFAHKVQNFFRRLVGKEEIKFERQKKNIDGEEITEKETITEQKN